MESLKKGKKLKNREKRVIIQKSEKDVTEKDKSTKNKG